MGQLGSEVASLERNPECTLLALPPQALCSGSQGEVGLLAYQKGHRNFLRGRQRGSLLGELGGFVLVEGAFQMGGHWTGEISGHSGRVFAESASSFTWFKCPALYKSPGIKA